MGSVLGVRLAARLHRVPANSVKSPSATRASLPSAYTVALWNLAGNSAMDRAALEGRLRHAIASEDGDEEDQLNGVLRMLGAHVPDENQLPLFGKPPAGQRSKLDARLARRRNGA
jgi:hypothetical protein